MEGIHRGLGEQVRVKGSWHPTTFSSRRTDRRLADYWRPIITCSTHYVGQAYRESAPPYHSRIPHNGGQEGERCVSVGGLQCSKEPARKTLLRKLHSEKGERGVF